MEIRARYFLIGLFVLAVIAASAGFTYWLWGVGGFAERTDYQIRFTGTVAGVSPGSEVLFNGIPVGEVTAMTFDPAAPADVLVSIAIDRNTPVRADASAGMVYSGLTGAGSISIAGGKADAPPLPAPPAGKPPVIPADNTALKDITQAARDTLNQVDGILSDNAGALKSAIAGIDTFAQALARNSDKVDTIVAGIERLTGGGGGIKTDYVQYDLPAATPGVAASQPDGQLVVDRPTAIVVLDTQRILVADANGDMPAFPDERWADSLPILVQARLIQSFENAGYARAASDDGRVSADFELALDLRAFHVVAAAAAHAEVSIAAKLIDADGRVLAGTTFAATAPVADVTSADAAASGLKAAFGTVAGDLVGWTLKLMDGSANAAPPPVPDPTGIPPPR
jgi:phospholipid/cholesterol/gamma-HCH transport system substrate-binding protein